jgi:erythromycin esterase-like protein
METYAKAHDLGGRQLEVDADLDPILEAIGGARHVLIGEASHGTSEFYTWRARLSQRLIEEKGFSFVAVEGDWPDLYRLNRYVKGYEGRSARAVVAGYGRWPTWMWANWEVVAFAEWLRVFNRSLREDRRVGIYGLDVYSLWESMERIIDFLRERDPEVARVALEAWRCFEPYGGEGQAYGWSTLSLVPQGCIAEAIELLTDIERRLPVYSQDWEAKLNLEQNAWIVVDAERYYRTMMKGGATSWNVRDRHMMSTLMRLEDYHGEGTRSIVWAHNTHIGDARATDMASTGMLNIGQLARERFGLADTHLVGLGSYTGSVVAARGWGEERETMIVPAASPGTWEGELHAALGSDRVLGLSRWRDAPELMTPRGHRAIGVVYHPEREHLGNFVPTVLPLRYDSFLYLEETNALHAIAVEPRLDREPPETYPFGL